MTVRTALAATAVLALVLACVGGEEPTVPLGSSLYPVEDGTAQGYFHFVVVPEARAAPHDQAAERLAKEAWDSESLELVGESMSRLAPAYSFFRGLERVRVDYAFALDALREADLPDVFAAIPYLESRYASDIIGPDCSGGPWQLPLEIAVFREPGSPGHLMVRGCSTGNGVWSPEGTVEEVTAARQVFTTEVQDHRVCSIERCITDQRTSLPTSTGAAIVLLSEAWRIEQSHQDSGAVHTTLRNWKHPLIDPYPDDVAAKYATDTVAQHLLAVCYYAQGEEAAFRPYARYIEDGGYCGKWRIPTQSEVLSQSFR